MTEPSSLASTASTTTMAAMGDRSIDGDTERDRDKRDKLEMDVERGDGTPDFTLPKRPWRKNPTAWTRVASHPYRGAGTEEEPYIVTWLPEDDLENPMRWPTLYKWGITIMAACGTLAVTMGSSILSAAIISVKASFPGHNNMEYILVTSIYILGFVLGPFLWGPGSEVFGRRWVYVVSLVPFVVFDSAVCGARTLNALLVFRFFAGVFGCSTMTNAGGIISDMFEADQRGLAMGVFGAMPWLGPVIGPIVGGFLGTAANWRWVAAVAAFFAAFISIFHFIWLPETYHPILLRRRATLLSESTGRVYRSERDAVKPFNLRELIISQLKVPYILLFTEPIVFILCLYMACVFGILYMQFTSFPLVFQTVRHWSPGLSALAFLGTSIGCNLALAYMIWFGNPVYARQLKKTGYMAPETRLPSACIGAVLMPIGLLIFAWTCVPAKIPWIICLLATIPFGGGMVLVFLAAQNYLVDAYLPTAASVMAGATVVRSLIGAILPLFTLDMYDALGINWASSLAGFIAIVFTPVPFLLLAYGRRIRRWTKHGRHADDHSIALAEQRRNCCADTSSQNENSPNNDKDNEKCEHSHLEEQDCPLDRVLSVP